MRMTFSGLASAKLCSHLTHLSSFRIVFLEVVLGIRSSYLVRHCGRRLGRHCHRPDLSAQSALCTSAVAATSGSRTERNILVLRSCALASPHRCRHRSTLDGHARTCRPSRMCAAAGLGASHGQGRRLVDLEARRLRRGRLEEQPPCSACAIRMLAVPRANRMQRAAQGTRRTARAHETALPRSETTVNRPRRDRQARGGTLRRHSEVQRRLCSQALRRQARRHHHL